MCRMHVHSDTPRNALRVGEADGLQQAMAGADKFVLVLVPGGNAALELDFVSDAR